MARVAVQYLVAVGDGSLVVAGKVVHRGALVPAFGEVGLALDDLGERGDRRLVLASLHLVDAACHEAVDGRIARAAPERP